MFHCCLARRLQSHDTKSWLIKLEVLIDDTNILARSGTKPSFLVRMMKKEPSIYIEFSTQYQNREGRQFLLNKGVPHLTTPR